MKQPTKNLILIVLLFLLIAFLFGFLSGEITEKKEIPLSQLAKEIKEEKVKEIKIFGDEILVTLKNGENVFSRKESGIPLVESLINLGVEKEKISQVEIKVQKTEGIWSWLGPILIYILSPLIFLFFFFWLLSRQAKTGAGEIFDFTKARARILGPGVKIGEKITFKDIADLEEAKEELKEVIAFLKNPKRYLEIGAKIPRGVLLIGPPGTGKTMLAKAVTNEAGVPFFSISGSEFIELFVGVGAARIRNLFSQARKVGKAIIFIDEIDSIGKVRGVGITGGHEEREQTLNQLLAEMDGITREEGLIVMAASVTGDTPVLVKKNGKCQLLPISQVIDPYYKEGEEGIEKPAGDLEVLGFERKKVKKYGPKSRIYFQNSAFKKVRGVFRHRVNEIYEVEYLGGKIKTTGNHSLFVRTKQGLKLKMVSQLKSGDILVDLPFKVNRNSKIYREIRAHKFNSEFNLELPVWQPLFEKFEPVNFAHEFALCSAGKFSQTKLGEMLGVSQKTISNWQRQIFQPRAISKNYYQHKDILPEKVKVTPKLCRLLGYYTAEGYARKGVDFCLNRNEKEKIEDIKSLMKEIFNLEPSAIRFMTPGAVNIVYNCTPVGKFFAHHCGKGAKNKHLPSFLFEAPFEYFKEFLKGYFGGDGSIDKRKRKTVVSVSKQLILELNWLFRMHGFKSYIDSYKVKAGRKIRNGKPLPETIAWRLGFGKTQNPLKREGGKANTKWPIVKSVRKIPYQGFVYDFCGCENEAFFAGESPILAHNTNRPELLDPALLRPGRFDRRIVLDLPDVKGREEILKIHCRGKSLALGVNLKEIAERTPGFSGADLANLVNEAALLAAKRGKKQIFQEEFLEAIEKVLLGPERKSHLLTQKEKEIAAYHEAGHAIVSAFLKKGEPVRKISIVARGLAAGYTLKTPKEERKIRTKSEFLAEISSLLGGYLAEKSKFGEITTGAANDLKLASTLARKMVKEYGMSSLGPITFGEREELLFLGREFEVTKDYSERLAEKIDKEVKKIIKEAERKALNLLRKKKRILEKVAKRLIEKETIEKEEFEQLIGKKK